MAKKNKPDTAAPTAAPAASTEAPPATTPVAEAPPAKPAKAPKPPKPEVIKEPEQNGIRKPAPGGKTRVPWDIADGISRETGRPATRDEVVKAAIASGCNPSMSQSQYARWRKFHGIVGRVSAPVATSVDAGSAPPATAPQGAEAVMGSNTSAFDAGYDAYANGTTRDQNPHTVGSNEAVSWEKGWDQANTDAQ